MICGMGDEYVKTEGDYSFWRTESGDVFRRWAPDNAQGRTPGALVDRHPSANEAAAKALSKRLGREIGLSDAERAAAMSEVANLNRDQARERARVAAVVGMTEQLGAGDPWTAWGEIVGAQAELAATAEGKGSTGAAEFVGRATGLLGSNQDNTGAKTIIQVAIVEGKLDSLTEFQASAGALELEGYDNLSLSQPSTGGAGAADDQDPGLISAPGGDLDEQSE